ncbi:MAG TPA: ABC transporter permease [Tenuifilaceae bacterium]|nr:ABC transporter permease [Tenuifilaceae bacterium]HPJ45566.1 ABC transporter permease [Tenuifilaceae bacterium]
MFRNYLTIGVRNLVRQKWSTVISIFGLSVAMALFTLISLYVWYESEFDQFHEKKDRIFFLNGDKWSTTPAPLSRFLADEFGEVEGVVRVLPFRNSFLMGEKGEELVPLKDVLVADSNVFNVFSFQPVKGSFDNPFPTWNSIALSETTARSLFGKEEPIGKTITLETSLIYTVTQVYKDLPSNSSLKAAAVIPFNGLDRINNDDDVFEFWGNWNYYTWILLREGVEVAQVDSAISNRVFSMLTNDLGWNVEGTQHLHLVPFNGLYFNKNLNLNMPKGSKNQLAFLSLVAFFILLIACINFVNLSTAKAFRRAKEVGLRKTVGASRKTLVVQFLVEVFILSLFSVMLSVMITEVFLPEFNSLVQANLSVYGFGVGRYLLIVIATLLFVTLMAGLYPALMLTSFSPVTILKGELTKGARGTVLRKVLIVFQFTVAIALSIATIVVYMQMKHMKNFDVGFSKEQVLYFWQGNVDRDLLKEKLLKIPGVDKVSFASAVPGDVGMSWGRVVDGKEVTFSTIVVEPEYLEIFEVDFAEGRNFSYDFASDTMGAMIFNEKAIRVFELDDPLSKTMNYMPEKPARIVGVVKDFHFESLHNPIEPLGFFCGNLGWGYYTCVVKISGNIPDVVKSISRLMQELRPSIPFDFRFVDQLYDSFYKKEERLSKSIAYFSLLAIVIACLGLFALASYSAEQKVKEIGVRKVLGASEGQIVRLITTEFGLYVLAANIIAWPIVYYGLGEWLKTFPQRIAPSLTVFAIVGAASFLIMQLTILYKAVKASRTNPSITLKYE